MASAERSVVSLSTPGCSPTSTAAAVEDLPPAADDPILCGHCGRTASNGIACQGMCVADSGY